MTRDRTVPGAADRDAMSISVRRARADDAREAAAVLRASISALCVADHGNDPEILAGWLMNKTTGSVRNWIEGPGGFVVAEEHGRIVGVGAAVPPGEIALNYVLPQARFRGVSKVVLSALEVHLREQGQTRATLTSTRTAHRFYRAMGYVDAAEPQVEGGLAAHRMSKDLASAAPTHEITPTTSPAGVPESANSDGISS